MRDRIRTVGLVRICTLCTELEKPYRTQKWTTPNPNHFFVSIPSPFRISNGIALKHPFRKGHLSCGVQCNSHNDLFVYV